MIFWSPLLVQLLHATNVRAHRFLRLAIRPQSFSLCLWRWFLMYGPMRILLLPQAHAEINTCPPSGRANAPATSPPVGGAPGTVGVKFCLYIDQSFSSDQPYQAISIQVNIFKTLQYACSWMLYEASLSVWFVLIRNCLELFCGWRTVSSFAFEITVFWHQMD